MSDFKSNSFFLGGGLVLVSSDIGPIGIVTRVHFLTHVTIQPGLVH